MHRQDFFRNGTFRDAVADRRIEVICPSTGDVVGSVPACGEADVDEAVAAARAAFDGGAWCGSSPAERATAIRAIADRLEQRSAEMTRLITTENGTPVSLCGPAHVTGPIANLRAHADTGEAFAFEQRRAGVTRTGTVLQEPVGVVAAIVPWNAPLHTAVEKLGPALMAGCTVVLKPSPETPLSSYLLAEAIQEAGLPPGVVNVLPGDGDTGRLLVGHEGVDKVSFTGSVDVGRAIMRACADRVVSVTLELGGKSPAVVLDDADLELTAARLAPRTMLLSGQVCVLLSRLLVPARLRDELVERLAAVIGGMTLGDPFDERTVLGPLISDAHRERVEGFIARARDDGARLVLGGGRPPDLPRGWYVQPTIFTGVDPSSELAQEEVFGPVLSVIDYSCEEEAMRIANGTRYGLAGAVFGRDPDRAWALARRIRAGTVGVNGYAVDVGLPTGGLKQSGLGREGGSEAIREFTEPRTLVVLD